VLSGYNANMRGTKGSPYEGGHRVPFYMHWTKGGMSKGRDITELTSYTDLLPTLTDLCSIKRPGNLNLDGRSLSPLLKGNNGNWTERIMVSDVQREEFLVKYKQYSVMSSDWRLVNGRELYKIKEDPGQAKNVADANPEKVAELKQAYEVWWERVSKRANEYSRVIVGSPRESPTALTAHDLHVEGNEYPAWSQPRVRAGAGVNGFWALQAQEAGKYTIELRRYPRESKLAIGAEAPQGDNVPGGSPYQRGKSLPIQRMKIKIGDQVLEKEVAENQVGCTFELDLKKGNFDLYTYMIDKNAKEYSAFYVYIEKKK
jgi:hypothetical protein